MKDVLWLFTIALNLRLLARHQVSRNVVAAGLRLRVYLHSCGGWRRGWETARWCGVVGEGGRDGRDGGWSGGRDEAECWDLCWAGLRGRDVGDAERRMGARLRARKVGGS
jgi:hypothetical protein